jgi:heme o synthase
MAVHGGVNVNTAIAIAQRTRSFALPRIRDYGELTKPRIATMVVVTVVLAALTATWGVSEPWSILGAAVGTALVAASASAVNQWLESETDQRMERTMNRPLPAGRLTGFEVIVFSLVLGIVGTMLLIFMTNALTTGLAIVTWLLYVAVYTPLKRVTAWNTVIGAVPGAMPVLMGWTAQGNALDVRGAALFLLVFLWQFPHFMAIAWKYRSDYRRGGLKMSTVTDPTGVRAGVQAILGGMAMLPVSMIPVIAGPPSIVYSVAALCLGVFYLRAAVLFAWKRDEQTTQRLLRSSLLYLPLMLIFTCCIPWMP